MADNNVSEQSFPVVGIGASAGGFDSLQRFLSVLPPDFGFSLVFIQHLSSKHKSLLPELLAAKRPSLVIQEISDGLKAEPGRLYLSPPAREIRLQKGIFRTTTHPEGLIHLPIDEFLSSLAEDAAERAIAVIFSGAGTDGARGCQAVRTAGGSVFIQDPETAEFSSMPLAAIATGQADAVLSPENICRELLKVQGIGAAAMSREVPITPEEFDAFFRILLDKTGGRFNHYKKSVVGRRLRRRMYLHGIASVKDYLDLVQARPSEAASLASDLMIGVTSFFRDRAAWKALTLEVVRKLAAENADAAIRIWTAASATGEEAYSITMLLSHELALAGKKRDIQVFATDVNDRALEQAREGRYPASISADVPREYIDKYFTYSDDGGSLIVTKEIRERVVFAKQDLLTDPPFSKLDLIICRNFLIYLEPEAQEKSIKLFHYALNSGGYLFLGNAETVGRKSALFKSIGHKQCRVYRKLDTKTASRLPISVPYATERQAPHAKQAQMTEQGRSVMEIIQEKLLEVYGPACVAIDQNYEIIYHNGPTNRYLRQPRGVPTHNLLTLLPENLRSRMRGAIYRANHEEKTVTMRASLPIAEENSPQPPVSRVKNRVRPSYAKQSREDLSSLRQVTLRIAKAATNLYIVVFQEKGARSKNEIALPADATVIEETVIHQLESELSATRADLQSHIEQLKSLNEELQSSNEELQAANEELETSREELQSLNEELITVNSQLQGKIEEQDVTNNDLNNFQTSTNIPMIFLDTHFRVKRFTPAMLKLIMLLPSDVGRPIVDMSQENLGPGLTSDAQAVLESLAPARRELEQGSAWYVRTALPYRTADNRIEGVVITYNDVTELKRAEECSRHLATFPQLNPNPVLEVDASGKVIFANPATERVLESLGLDKGETAVLLPKDLDAILRALTTNSESFFPREVSVKDQVFSETVQLIPQFNAARIYAYDITERKRAEEVVRRLAVVVQTTNDAVIIHDFEGNITSWNKSAERMYGYTEAEALKMKVRGIIPPDKLSETLVYLEKLRLGESVTSFESKRLTKEGRVFDVWLTVTVLFDEQGKPAAVAMTERDITERRNANEALRVSQERLNRAQEIAHLGSWELELVENRLFWSDEVYRIFGLKPQEFGATYEAFLERVHPDDREAVNAAYTGSLRDNRDTYELEHRVIRQDTGETRSVHEKCEHFRDGSGKIIRSVGMVHDVTERKEAENEVLKLSEDMAARNLELEVLNRELEAFVYSVSHDLRAPLRSVSGFAKIIMEDYAGRLDDQGRDHLARIYNGSEKMSQRIEALLRLTKISRQELDRAPVDLSRVASTIAYELGEANGGRNVEAVIAPELTAYVDLNLIKVVLSNLLENAWKFTAKTDHARIELGAVDSPLRIAECGLRDETTAEQVKQGKTVYYIRDNGAGFDPAYADRMFWPFHRLHSDTEFEGTGIGLAIVERVIRRHGGSIWAEGEPGKGAAFYFTLG
jgi:two-component system CheB/CheR fusion protein